MIDKLKNLKNLAQNTPISLRAIITEAKELRKKDETMFLQLSIQDTTGSMDFPVWDFVEERIKILLPGKVISVTGKLTFYENKPQIKDPLFYVLDNVDPQEFIPRYIIPKELIDYFENTVSVMDTKYKRFIMSMTGCMGSSKWKWDLFTSAPAAKSNHHSKIGGLFLHTVGVMKNVENMLNLYVDKPFLIDASNVINKDRIMTKAILHDIGKVGEYEWLAGIKRKKIVRDHIMMCVSYMERTNLEMDCFDEEELDNMCASIMTHHGKYSTYGYSEMTTAEDYILHLADMIDSQIVRIVEGSR